MTYPLATHRIANGTAGSLRIYLEPWGEEYTLGPGEHADLLIEFPAEHPVEWELRDGSLVISSMATSDASLTIRKDEGPAEPGT
jgi:hypothetical protein